MIVYTFSNSLKCTEKRGIKKSCDGMTIYLSDTLNRFYNAADWLKMKISYEAHDFHATDIHYRSSCYIKFILKSLSTIAAEEQNMLEMHVFEEFCLQSKKRITWRYQTSLWGKRYWKIHNYKHQNSEKGKL